MNATVIRRQLLAKVSTSEGGYRDDQWVNMHLVYDPCDPHAVTFDFGYCPVDEQSKRWTFALITLDHGRTAPAGEADVHIFPSTDNHVSAILTSPDGQAILIMQASGIDQFFRQIEEADRESRQNGSYIDWNALNVDSTIDRILEEAEI